MATVKKCGPNHEGRYRISCWSAEFGHTVDFKAEDVEPVAVVYASGEVFNPSIEFETQYTVDERVTMANHERYPKIVGTPPFTPERALHVDPQINQARQATPIQRVRPLSQPLAIPTKITASPDPIFPVRRPPRAAR